MSDVRRAFGREHLRKIKQQFHERREQAWVRRAIPPFPSDVLVPTDEAEDVLLLCSRMAGQFDAKVAVAELAFAHELATRSRKFAITDDPASLFDKSIVWFLPNILVTPRLWDYSRQVRDFVAGLERQGNRMFCSADELTYWENKGAMHRRLAETGVRTPETRLLAHDQWQSVSFDIEPVLVKEEHSAGSEGVHFFGSAGAARQFVEAYPFRPGESLIMQEVVAGATRDLRLTMVGDRMIPSASFWRSKRMRADAEQAWTTTASKHGSLIEHRDIPPQAVSLGADLMRKLGLRTAGIDLIWPADDVSGPPLVLEASPYFQPNPPKPERYGHLSYHEYKSKPYAGEGYMSQQYLVYRAIAAEVLDQRLF